MEDFTATELVLNITSGFTSETSSHEDPVQKTSGHEGETRSEFLKMRLRFCGQSSGSCWSLVAASVSLTVLGVLLAIAVLKRPPEPRSAAFDQDLDRGNSSKEECSMFLVESLPRGMRYKANVSLGIPLERAWKDLVAMATEEVEIVSFYWTLVPDDINLNSTSGEPGLEVLELLGGLPSRNVSVRLLTSVPSIRTNTTDLDVLQKKGARVRSVDLGRLTGGVLHSKFWIVDRRHVWIGSANMDWRALTQVKEVGVVIHNCSSLAKDLQKIFESYWTLGVDNSSLPRPWPPEYDTDFNLQHPLVVKTGNVSSHVYLAASPPAFCPQTRTLDLDAILSIISRSRHFVDVAVMDYFPTIYYTRNLSYWPVIDDALRTAAYNRRVKIRMLISCGTGSDPRMLPFLQSLAVLDRVEPGVSIQIKLFIVPVGNFSDVPYARINHNKYMVTERTAYVGTSNWAGDYYINTAGVGLVISHRDPDPEWTPEGLHPQLRSLFQRDWTSEFAVGLDDLGHCQDCALCT